MLDKSKEELNFAQKNLYDALENEIERSHTIGLTCEIENTWIVGLG